MRSKSSVHPSSRQMTVNRFCRCIKAVHKKTPSAKEKRAIAICVSSVLQRKGRTLKRFRCRSPAFLQTQAFPRPSRR